MGNRERGVVDFEVDGATWSLRFDVNALCELEDRFDQSIEEIGHKLEAGRVVYMRAALAIGLRGRHPSIDEGQAGELMDELGLAVAVEKIAEAFAAMQPPAAGKSDRPRKAGQRAPTGSPS